MGSTLSIAEAAALWGCSRRCVQLYCRQGAVPGARKVSGVWLLPADSIRPGRPGESPPPLRPEALYGRNATVRVSAEPPGRQAAEHGCVITEYPIVEGITLVFQDIHEEALDYGGAQPQLPPDLIAIQYCREGRFEGAYPDGECIYMGPGSLSVNLPAWAPVSNSFPLHHYHGFYLAIAPGAAAASIRQLEQVLGPLHLDFSALTAPLSDKNKLALFTVDDQMARLLEELCPAGGAVRREQLKLRVLELLQLLCAGESARPGPAQYFPREQVQTVKEIRQYLLAHLDRHIPLPELAGKFHISLTAMKACFKGVFGQPMGRYLREYRLQAGAELLAATDTRIIAIAAALGYENASKFSEAFAGYFGLTPREYRKNFCPAGAIVNGKE